MTTQERTTITYDSDQALAVLGVPGRLTHRTVKPGERPGCWTRQRWISEARPITGYGAGGAIRVTLRFDDDLSNGHNTYAITADVVTTDSRRQRDSAAGGCLHEDIARIFPELAPLIKWHLTSADGPMHYIANTVYHAGDRDYRGLRKGETKQLQNGKTQLPVWTLVAVNEAGDPVMVRTGGMLDAAEKPDDPDVRIVYRPYLIVGEGKARELDHARASAVWPEATDEELSAEPEVLRAKLAVRLPGLLMEFRAAMEACGFLWSPADYRKG